MELDEEALKYGYDGIDDGFLEKLVEAGYPVIPKSKLPGKAKRIAKRARPNLGHPYWFALYDGRAPETMGYKAALYRIHGGRDPEVLYYNVALSDEAKELIKQEAARRAHEATDFDTIKKITHETDSFLFYLTLAQFWLEDPIKAKNKDYLKNLILTMENIKPNERIRKCQEEYGLRFKPVFNRDFIPDAVTSTLIYYPADFTEDQIRASLVKPSQKD